MKRPYPSYRHSGVEWLGDVPEHWDVRQLGRIGSFFKGGGGTKADEVEGGVPCVRYGDLYTQHQFLIKHTRAGIAEDATGNYRRLRYGDVLFAGSGETIEEIGKSAVSLIEDRSYCGGDVIVFRPAIKVDAAFLGYAGDCRPSIYQKACMGRGVTVMHIYSSELKQLVIPLPPLREQQAISAFLDHETAQIDALIAKKQQLIERLAEYRTALITRTVTRGLTPDAATAAGIDPAPPLKASGVEWIGDVPEHWAVHPLRWVLQESLKYGANEAADLDDPDLPRYVRITDIKNSRHLRDETFRSLAVDVAAPYLLADGDLLFARSGATVGITFLYNVSLGPCAFAGYLIRARIDTARAIPEFISYFSVSHSYASWLRTQMIQATIENVSAERYSQMPVPVPPIGEQRAIISFLDRLTEAIDVLSARVETAIERLQEYRTALITAAVTGKIDVREQERVRAGARV